MAWSNAWIHSLWLARAYKDFRHFVGHVGDAGEIQRKYLLELVHRNRSTAFGEAHRFFSIHDIERFKGNVPIREYDPYMPWLDRTIRGEKNVLTREKILLFQPTGGTSRGSKLIPYTRSLKEEFQKAIHTWIYDLYRRVPGLLGGRSYWSITPKGVKKDCTEGGIPIGFEEDTEYLGWTGRLLEKILVAPPEMNRLKHMENLRYGTLYFLLAAEDLALVSIWNPSLLTLLLDDLDKYPEELLRDIRDGCLTPPIPEDLHFLKRFCRSSPERARDLSKLLALPEDERFPRVWPKLKLISCWREGPSAYHAEVLSKKFPHAALQGKGLIATEGFVSFPLMEAEGTVPAYRSHFLEFLAEGETDTRLIDQIDEGEAYSVILTTGGGLYRYHLKDKIEVTGRHEGIPLIRFVGRENVSDMVGEKLEETHVQRIVCRTLERHGIDVRFLLVSPEVEERGGYYVVFLELMDETEKGRCEYVAQEIEEGLRENFQYRHASDLEQVLPLRVFLIDGDGTGAYLRRCVEEGQKMGDVKHVVLDKRAGWTNRFEGTFV